MNLSELTRLNRNINDERATLGQIVIVSLTDLKTLLDFVDESKLPRNHPVVWSKDRMGDCLFVARNTRKRDW